MVKTMMKSLFCTFFMVGAGIVSVWAQAPPNSSEEKLKLGAEADAAVVTKYLWRGQRLTDDWSLQPSGTFSIGSFSINVWGNLDLAAVNEGDVLLISENPASTPGNSRGLQGKFSEVDYTFSYQMAAQDASIEFGSIFYTFPDRSESLPSTVELFGGIALETVPLSPAFTIYLDVDETRNNSGDMGLYFQVGASHAFTLGHPRLPVVDLSGWISFVNEGFSEFYYGAANRGVHDVNVTLTLPIQWTEKVSAGAFLSYSALLGNFRDHQLPDPRQVYRGTAGSPATFADTFWGGIQVNLSF